MPEKKIKHLEMIEAIIERMAKNCFQLKGWAMTLVALVGTLGSQGSEKKFMLLAFIPVIDFVFWMHFICSKNVNTSSYIKMLLKKMKMI